MKMFRFHNYFFNAFVSYPLRRDTRDMNIKSTAEAVCHMKLGSWCFVIGFWMDLLLSSTHSVSPWPCFIPQSLYVLLRFLNNRYKWPWRLIAAAAADSLRCCTFFRPTPRFLRVRCLNVIELRLPVLNSREQSHKSVKEKYTEQIWNRFIKVLLI